MCDWFLIINCLIIITSLFFLYQLLRLGVRWVWGSSWDCTVLGLGIVIVGIMLVCMCWNDLKLLQFIKSMLDGIV